MNDYPKILYVEDDYLSRMVIHILLQEKLDLQHVVILEDSQHFIDRIENLPFMPDIILLDIHMKPLNGFQMLSLLRDHPVFQHTLVVALTASVMNEEIDQLRNAGFNGVLAKPLDEDLFPEQLRRLLEGEAIWTVS